MQIVEAACTPGVSAFYFDDQAAIKNGAHQDGFFYDGECKTLGFSALRQMGEAVLLECKLANGRRSFGDCVAVQYSGAGGRDGLFLARNYLYQIKCVFAQHFPNLDATNFRTNANLIDNLTNEDGTPLHTAIRYGVSQLLLDAAANATNKTKAEVICTEYDLPLIMGPLRFFGQCGDDRYTSVDKMILKGVSALPHGLINNIQHKLGTNGGRLQEYVSWISDRIKRRGISPNYTPDIHIDVYGTIGMIFENDVEKIAEYMVKLAEAASPFNLYIEGPVDAGSKNAQIEALYNVRAQLQHLGSNVKIIADEWCNNATDIREFVDAKCCHMVQIKTPDLGSIHNTIEAVLYCKENEAEAYLGGSCNETDISARCSVHIALATRPDRVLIKPGMGFDEGHSIMTNECQRALSQISPLRR